MRFCKHDWHIHWRGQASWQYNLLVHNVTSPLIWACSSFGFFASTWVIGYHLLLNSDKSFFVSVAISFVYFMVYPRVITDMHTNKHDPWITQDKTCVKCNKIVLDATKLKEKNDILATIASEKRSKRDAITAKADERYKKWTKLRAKGNVNFLLS